MKTNLNIVYPLLTFVIWYSLGIKCIIHFGIPTFCWAHYQLFFFCRSIKAKSRFRFFLMFASWIWLSRKIASVVPRPAMNLNCICNALRGLVPFVQFKKREKHPRRSVTFSKVAGFTKSNTPPWVFFTFFKLYKWYQIAHCITFFFYL